MIRMTQIPELLIHSAKKRNLSMEIQLYPFLRPALPFSRNYEAICISEMKSQKSLPDDLFIKRETFCVSDAKNTTVFCFSCSIPPPVYSIELSD